MRGSILRVPSALIVVALAGLLTLPLQAQTTFRNQADQAWKELEALRPPAEPSEWATQQPTDEDRREFQKKQVEFACRAADLARDFYTRFPNHDMAPIATGLERQFMGPFQSDVLDYRAQRIEQQALKRKAEGESVVLAEMEKGAREMLTEFPYNFVPSQLLLKVARQLEADKARKLAKEVRDTKNLPDFVKEEAADLLKKLDRIGKPFTLEFRAVDEREVDLNKLKGKVVLVDFWATWCVPCVSELPTVKAVYDKLVLQGFEIVGISFDQQKEALTRFLEKEKIPWPQFFDGKVWKNKFGQEFGVGSIPTMWLVDKRGILRDLNARNSLEEKVEKLLAETP
jgi:thiol-disulfide isomerase/thioredoxin